MPQTIDLINFPFGDDVTRWPKLTCTQPGQLDLQDAGLHLPGSRDILFQDNGQIRSFDDTHRLVFDRAGGLLELHEAGAIRFLTGSPTPTEKMRILATGQVGIGTATPTSPLHVTGDIRTDGALLVAGNAAVGGTLTVGSNVGIGTTTPTQKLEVAGTVKATGFQGDGAALTGVRATDSTKVAKTGDTMSGALAITAAGTGLSITNNAAVGGTLTVGSNVGIGTQSPAEALDVNGRIKSGALTMGPWPANPSYMFLGTNVLNQADPGNYALLQGAAASPGVTFLNSPASIQFRIRNADKMVLANNGQLQILADSNPIRFTAGWTSFPDAITNGAEISNDIGTYKTLMIVGNRSAGIGRRVSVWDRLEVNGLLFVNGNVGIGTNGPTHRFHVLAPDAVGLFESTGTQAYLRLSTSEGINNRVEITNRPGGRLTLWTAGAGDVFTISRDGQIFLGNNRTGPFVRLNDDMWFSDPQNGTIHVRNGNNSNWGTLVGIFNNQSSRAYKKTITALQAPDCDRLLNDALHTNLVTFRYKGDDEQHRLRLGVISEESPSYIVGDDGESLSSSEYIAMLHGAIKALANRLVALEEKVAAITG
jgi:hypothetical protein